MVKPAPPLDPRTADAIARQVQDLLRDYAPEWQAFVVDPRSGVPLPNPRNAALLGVFAHFVEVIIQRLNQVPDKNFLAFLNLLGASQLPPQPARVPLTFTLAPGSTVGVVPAGTQVAAPPSSGEQDPVIYETEADLVVTAAQLVAAFAEDLAFDRYTDHRALLSPAEDTRRSVFHCDRPIEHRLYLAHEEQFALPDIKALRLRFTLAEAITADDRTLVWEYFDGAQYLPLVPQTDETQQLTRSGTVVFGNGPDRDSASLPAINFSTVFGRSQPWLRCRLLTPITPATAPRAGMVRASQLPSLVNLQTQAEVRRTGLRLDAAFANQTALDLNRAILPFGEKPRLGDGFYLACREGFAQAQAEITLTVIVLNEKRLPAPPAGLQWEMWDGDSWLRVADVSDTTQAFTQSGAIDLTLPSQPQTITFNGVEAFWLRAKIVSGDYGREATYLPRTGSDPQRPNFDPQNRQIIDFTPATFNPPLLDRVTVDCAFTTPEAPPTAVLTDNHQTYRLGNPAAAAPLRPFQNHAAGDRPALYLGFQLPPEMNLQNRPLSLFFQAAAANYGEREVPLDPSQSYALGDGRAAVKHRVWITNSSDQSQSYGLSCLGQSGEATPAQQSLTLAANSSRAVDITVVMSEQGAEAGGDRTLLLLTRDQSELAIATLETAVANQQTPTDLPRLSWQYWNGDRWANLTVQDSTANLTRTGIVTCLFPSDWQPQDRFGQAQHWLRIVWTEGNYAVPPRLQRVLSNTTTATQTITLRNEILGSSDGTEGQRFQALRSPVLSHQQLEIRETEALATPPGSASAWVPWQEVPDFYGSGPQDRHYVLNHISGAIQFGNGISGRIPPLGRGNVRLTRYQTGGGLTGNRPVGAIAQLKTTIPYIKQVTNLAPAIGGAEAETLEFLKERAPRTVRHGDRAVTREDFEDLAHLASPEVARARCVPLVNLAAAPLATPADSPSLGYISVIVVPRTEATQPIPSLELIDRVTTYLTARALPTASLAVVGPLYIPISITLELVPLSLDLAGTVEKAVQDTLTQFLHPLYGGPRGQGWEFGRRPHKSDLYALIEAIPGVDHIRYLTVDPDDPPPPAIQAIFNTERFLVYSGTHTILLTA
ncbi:putative baseplate assembly protein [Nodosilinea sp. PGN35]|uniref:putative baseplate assembly protein n=1 Tax=Nodosilinea sp. PGN35 TaxID=3020489 RepID=UPI0023B2546E|nr:putative baseplate assembly protein [Nodosilinea sp. TSF1-S3]MDF0367882.1 putative baseplate assembly protein [Nodosilinea sp. TSF1-S3]